MPQPEISLIDGEQGGTTPLIDGVQAMQGWERARHRYRAYPDTRYTPSPEGDAFILCFRLRQAAP